MVKDALSDGPLRKRNLGGSVAPCDAARHHRSVVVKVTFTCWRCQNSLDAVEIVGSARRHDVDDADIVHAWENAIRYVEYEYSVPAATSI